MRSDTISFVLILSVVIIDSILFVMFGQKTVSKLRNNPAIKDSLGIEFISGWDIIHVANALALPEWLTRKVRRSRLSAFFANAEVLKKHVTKFDVVIAKLFWGLWIAWTSALVILMLIDKCGVFA